MEILLVLAFVALVVWLVARHGRAATPSTQARPSGSAQPSIREIVREQRREVDRETARMMRELDAAVEAEYGPPAPVARPSSRNITGDHRPPPPTGDPIRAWSPQTQQFEVAGEWYRADSLVRIFQRHARVSASGDEIGLPAALVPDPANPYDPNAVAVFVDGLHVGYLERRDAQTYHGALAALAPRHLEVDSRQWLRASDGDVWARVTLSLPTPTCITCPNPTPDNAAILPAGATIQVTREDEHMDVLGQLLKKYGTEAVLAATLHSATEVRPRSTVEVIEVAIDGARVGVLSPTQTANLLPIVRRAESLGLVATARARLRGNSLKADVTLFARKAHEIAEDELAAILGEDGASE